MNDRIIQFAKEAGLGTLGVKGDFIYFQPGTDGLKKFTELILKECSKVAVDCDVTEYSDFRQGVAQEIKQHFGVKE